MLATLPMLTAGLACLALALGLWQVSRKLKELEAAAQRQSEPPAPAPTGRASGSRPMLSALYTKEEPSGLESVSGLPGGRWVVAAAALALAAVLLSAMTRATAAPPAPASPDSTVTVLRQRVDSLAMGLGVLRDSIRVLSTVGPQAKPAPAPTTRIARRPAAPATGLIPSAPPPPVGSTP